MSTPRNPSRPARYISGKGRAIKVQGRRILRVRCHVLVGTADHLIAFLGDTNDPETDGGLYLALTGCEVGVKTDEYSSRIPSVDLDFRDCDGIPAPGGGDTVIGLTTGTAGTYVKSTVTAHWQVWYYADQDETEVQT